MSNEYRNNHYVPIWYQKRFLLSDQKNKELYYLYLRPGSFIDPRGVKHAKRNPRRWGLRYCFAENDLYITHFGPESSTEIEVIFFGEIDSKGQPGVEYFANFKHPSVDPDALHNILMYMSTQKLRTPKGLGWLSDKAGTTDRDIVLQLMLEFREFHCAIWSECIWLIADASQSATKFIIRLSP